MFTFTFKGQDSRSFGITVGKRSDINTPGRRIETLTISGQDGSIYDDLGAENYVITFPIYIEKKSDIDKIKGWIQGEGFFTRSDLENRKIQVYASEALVFSRLSEGIYTADVTFTTINPLWEVDKEDKYFNKIDNLIKDDFSDFNPYQGATVTKNKTFPIEVFKGGRNYLLNSGETVYFGDVGGRNWFNRKNVASWVLPVGGSSTGSILVDSQDGYKYTKGTLIKSSGTYRFRYTFFSKISEKAVYTFSFWYKTNKESRVSISVNDVGFGSIVENSSTDWKFFSASGEVGSYLGVHGFVQFDPLEDSEFIISDVKFEKGNTATDWTPAPEDCEEQDVIPTTVEEYLPTESGRNLISGLPINWEQGTISYGNNSSSVSRIRLQEYIEVAGNTSYVFSTNESHYALALAEYDEDKNFLFQNPNNYSSMQHRITNNDTKFIRVAIANRELSNINPSHVVNADVKLEQGSTPTPWTPAPEDFNNLKGKSYALSQPLQEENTLSLNGSFEEDDFIGLWLGDDKFIGFLDNQELGFDLGGRNYFRPSKVENTAIRGSVTSGNITGDSNYKSFYISVKKDEVWSLSRTEIGNANRFGYTFSTDEPLIDVEVSGGVDHRNDLKVEGIKIPFDGWLYIYLANNVSDAGSLPKIKLEKGDIATNWTPAPEDFNSPEFAVVKTLSEKGIIDNAKLELGSTPTEYSPAPEDGYDYTGSDGAYHIQTSGGANLVKYYKSYRNIEAENQFIYEVKTHAFNKIRVNYGSKIKDLEVGQGDKLTDIVTLATNGRRDLQFRTLNVDNSLDFIASDPSIVAESEWEGITTSINNRGTAVSKPIIRLVKKTSSKIDVVIGGERLVYTFPSGDKEVIIDCDSQEVYDETGRSRQRNLLIGYNFPSLKVGTSQVTRLSGDANIYVRRRDRWQ